MWQFTPIAWLYVISILLSFTLAVHTWQLRPTRGAALLSALLVSNGTWALGFLLGFFNTLLKWKLIFLRVEYLGIIGSAFFYALFVLTYTHYERWVNRRTVAVLASIAIAAFILVLTAPHHDFFYRSYGIKSEGGLILFTKVYGPGFWILAGYDYTIVALGALILIQTIIRFPDLFRGQIGILIPAVLIPMIPNVLYVAGLNPFKPYDPSSIFFVFTGLMVVVSMARYHFMDIIPVAHDLVFKNVNSGVVILDKNLRMVDMNSAAEHILDYPCDKALGKPIKSEHHDLLLDENNTEIQLGEHVYELQASPLTDRAGRPSGRVIILHDITQRKETDAEREQLIADLEAYAHTVAHDLKNPIGAILGIANLLVEDADKIPPEEAGLYLKQIMQGSEKMSNIIDELLLLASIRRHEEIKTSRLHMGYIVDRSLDRLSFLVEKYQAEIIRPEDNVWPDALGYGPWIEEIWTNYISNAIKYGGIPPKLSLGATVQDDGMVRFWVQDNGAGITPEKQARLFTQFTRFDELHAEGHGLGLSIVKRIIDKLGGEVGVESEGVPGKGSIFYFTLPPNLDD